MLSCRITHGEQEEAAYNAYRDGVESVSNLNVTATG
jgi:hypothetical protein